MVALRRPLMVALIIGAGISSTVAYRRLSAVDTMSPGPAVVHGTISPNIANAPVMRAGLLQFPVFGLGNTRAASPDAVGPNPYALIATPASLALVPDENVGRAGREPVSGKPIQEGIKNGAGAWPQSTRDLKGSRKGGGEVADTVAYMPFEQFYPLLPISPARPMARLSRKLQPPDTDTGLARFSQMRIGVVLASHMAQSFLPMDDDKTDHSEALAGSVLPTPGPADGESGAILQFASVLPDTPDNVRTSPYPIERAVEMQAEKDPPALEISAAPEKPSIPERPVVADAPVRSEGRATPISLAPVAYTKARICMAIAIYFEARNESWQGQVAVGQVILNRLRSPSYPKTICDVVYQGVGQRLYGGCQFSFVCDGTAVRITQSEAWERAMLIAKRVMDAKEWIPEVGNATHYHADYVRPYWLSDMVEKDRIGRHIFYRVKSRS